MKTLRVVIWKTYRKQRYRRKRKRQTYNEIEEDKYRYVNKL